MFLSYKKIFKKNIRLNGLVICVSMVLSPAISTAAALRNSGNAEKVEIEEPIVTIKDAAKEAISVNTLSSEDVFSVDEELTSAKTTHAATTATSTETTAAPTVSTSKATEKTSKKEENIIKAEADVYNLLPLGRFKITGYCGCPQCSPNVTQEITGGASGLGLADGATIGVNPKQIPYGSKVMIRYRNGDEKIYTATDTGGGAIHSKYWDNQNGLIDVYFHNHYDAETAAAKGYAYDDYVGDENVMNFGGKYLDYITRGDDVRTNHERIGCIYADVFIIED